MGTSHSSVCIAKKVAEDWRDLESSFEWKWITNKHLKVQCSKGTISIVWFNSHDISIEESDILIHSDHCTKTSFNTVVAVALCCRSTGHFNLLMKSNPIFKCELHKCTALQHWQWVASHYGNLTKWKVCVDNDDDEAEYVPPSVK